MKINIKLFSSYRENAGVNTLTLNLPSHATVSTALDTLLQKHTAISSDKEKLVTAVNGEYQDHEFELHDGDELALIPPVSGG